MRVFFHTDMVVVLLHRSTSTDCNDYVSLMEPRLSETSPPTADGMPSFHPQHIPFEIRTSEKGDSDAKRFQKPRWMRVDLTATFWRSHLSLNPTHFEKTRVLVTVIPPVLHKPHTKHRTYPSGVGNTVHHDMLY